MCYNFTFLLLYGLQLNETIQASIVARYDLDLKLISNIILHTGGQWRPPFVNDLYSIIVIIAFTPLPFTRNIVTASIYFRSLDSFRF